MLSNLTKVTFSEDELQWSVENSSEIDIQHGKSIQVYLLRLRRVDLIISIKHGTTTFATIIIHDLCHTFTVCDK